MSKWGPMPLILASGSPFRRKMLEDAGLEFEVVKPEFDERAFERLVENSASGPEGAKFVARALALAKTVKVSEDRPEAVVIGCDQVLQLGTARLSKPTSREIAATHLEMLRGKTHLLHSAVCIAHNCSVLWRHVGTARLTMRKFSEDFLDAYLDAMGDRVCQTVGAYEIEGRGMQLFERIEGDHFTIVGLPLLPLLAKLRELGQIKE